MSSCWFSHIYLAAIWLYVTHIAIFLGFKGFILSYLFKQFYSFFEFISRTVVAIFYKYLAAHLPCFEMYRFHLIWPYSSSRTLCAVRSWGMNLLRQPCAWSLEGRGWLITTWVVISLLKEQKHTLNHGLDSTRLVWTEIN